MEQKQRLETKLNADAPLQQMLETLLVTVSSKAEGDLGKDRWANRLELRTFRKMIQFPITCLRVHGVKRRQLYCATKGNQVRISICRSDDKCSWSVHIHTLGMEYDKVKRLKVPWQGVTCFFKVASQPSTCYIQLPSGVLAEVNVQGSPWDVSSVCATWCGHEAYLLAMKSSGKELDPTKFDQKESEAFEEADKTEWASWIRNGVVRIVPSHEVASIPRSRIFPVPARVIRVNKNKDGGLFAKSRMVIPGHLDPALGEARSDAPTVSPEVICMMISIATSRNWGIITFDVTTAFLQGNPTTRKIYIRSPKQSLPALEEHGLPEIPPCMLLQVLNSAYGLSEAPRLWFLRAHEQLLEIGFKQVEAAPCCYRWVEGDSVMALLSLHVDDGLVVADLQSNLWRQIQAKINKAFTIKGWVTVSDKPLEHLGMELRSTSDGYEVDMSHYVVQKIEEVPTRKAKGVALDQPLDDKEKLAFRSLLAKVAWPARKVGLAFAYRCSRLASAANQATQADQLALWSLTREMQEVAKRGELKLCYKRGQTDGVQLVGCHDASFAREPGGKSQAGYIIGLASPEIERGQAPFHMVSFSTHRIKRVVKSTMAAESAAVAEAADMMQYLLVLYRQMTEGQWQPDRDWQAALSGYKYPGVLVTDGKSLYDHLSTTGSVPSEKQVLLDLLYVKEQVEQGRLRIRWVPGSHQLSDILTKEMKPTAVLQQFLSSGCYALVQDEVAQQEEERQQGLRREQRQRYKTRKRTAIEAQSKHTFTPV
eukprot:6487924-Amphidinium_carterae.1